VNKIISARNASRLQQEAIVGNLPDLADERPIFNVQKKGPEHHAGRAKTGLI
jgi:hypothetical protein